ncbi:transposase family protein, partial [Microcoleus sp. herbarium2]|uniref:transposase family protein n=1 Tax=Microcoleus sp. herbarium2 TaxID=3055433 RepID=UPI002FCEB030
LISMVNFLLDVSAKVRCTPVTSPQKQTDSWPSMNILNASFLQHFAKLNDQRIERSTEHLLRDIIAIAILAVISGADGWVAIEAYGNAKYEWLKSFLELPNGIPSNLMTYLVEYLPELNRSSFNNVFLVG